MSSELIMPRFITDKKALRNRAIQKKKEFYQRVYRKPITPGHQVILYKVRCPSSTPIVNYISRFKSMNYKPECQLTLWDAHVYRCAMKIKFHIQSGISLYFLVKYLHMGGEYNPNFFRNAMFRQLFHFIDSSFGDIHKNVNYNVGKKALQLWSSTNSYANKTYEVKTLSFQEMIKLYRQKNPEYLSTLHPKEIELMRRSQNLESNKIRFQKEFLTGLKEFKNKLVGNPLIKLIK